MKTYEEGLLDAYTHVLEITANVKSLEELEEEVNTEIDELEEYVNV